MKINKKKFLYLISPNKILNSFYKELIQVLKSNKVSFFQLRLKKDNFKKKLKIAKKIMQFNLIRKNNFDNSLGPLFIKKTIKDNPIHPLYCSDNSILQSYF